MSQWDKLISKIKNLSKDLRFEEIKKVLESYGYTMHAPNGGSVIELLENKIVIQLLYQRTIQ